MKTTRKLIPALAMLLVSAIMLSTASFAWFAMSTQVSANKMQVNVKSDSIALVIAAEGDDIDATTAPSAADVRSAAARNASGSKISVDGVAFSDEIIDTDEPGAFDVYPSAYTGSATATSLKTAGTWYTGSSADAGDHTMSGDEQYLPGFEGYVIRYKYYVTLSAGSNDITNLRVSSLTMKPGKTATGDDADITAVRAVVTCGDVVVEFNNGKTSDTTNLLANGTTNNNGTLSDDTVAEVYVYVYYDGNDESVTTNNIDTLGSATINLSLSVPSAT